MFEWLQMSDSACKAFVLCCRNRRLAIKDCKRVVLPVKTVLLVVRTVGTELASSSDLKYVRSVGVSRAGVINFVEGDTKEEGVWGKAVLKSPTST